MDASLNKLKAKIDKLTAQQRQIEEKYIGAVAHLLKDTTQKGLDLPILTGIILNAQNIINDHPTKKEVWQAAGEKFLLRSKNRNAQRKVATKN